MCDCKVGEQLELSSKVVLNNVRFYQTVSAAVYECEFKNINVFFLSNLMSRSR